MNCHQYQVQTQHGSVAKQDRSHCGYVLDQVQTHRGSGANQFETHQVSAPDQFQTHRGFESQAQQLSLSVPYQIQANFGSVSCQTRAHGEALPEKNCNIIPDLTKLIICAYNFWHISQHFSGNFWDISQYISGNFWDITHNFCGNFWNISQHF